MVEYLPLEREQLESNNHSDVPILIVINITIIYSITVSLFGVNDKTSRFQVFIVIILCVCENFTFWAKSNGIDLTHNNNNMYFQPGPLGGAVPPALISGVRDKYGRVCA